MANGDYRNLNNQEYWLRRSEERVSSYWKNLDNVEKSLAKNYRMVAEDINNKLAELYSKYAADNNLTYKEAIQKLSKHESGIYREQIKAAIAKAEGNPALVAELKKLLPTTQVTRLQATLNQIEANLLELGYQEQITIEDWLSDTYESNYYESVYEIQKGIGIGLAFTKLNERAIREAITYPWSGDMFSDRVWDNKRKLLRHLRQTVTQGLTKGESYQKMARNMSSKMDSSYKDSLRLIRTETSAVVSQSTAKGYEESGLVSQYIIIATLDNKTGNICQHQDMKVYDLKDREIGVNAEPFHPNCRSTSAVYFGKEFQADMTRIARGENGKNYKVPATMNYKEWKSKYVDGEAA